MNPNFSSVSKDGTSFVENKVLNTHKNIILDKKVDVVGNNFVIKDDLLINAEVSFTNVTFDGGMIYLKNKAKAEFVKCTFKARNSLTKILMYRDSNNSITIDGCTFINYSTAIIVGNNEIHRLSNNNFIGCTMAIDIDEEALLKSLEAIYKNVVINSKNSLLFIIHSKMFDLECQLKYIRDLVKKNNGRIQLKKDENIVIDTYEYFVKDNDELKETLKQARDGCSIYLEPNIYEGDIQIYKSIRLVGKSGVIIEPHSEEKSITAIEIEAPYVIIENLNIQSNNKGRFRDGIRFTLNGGYGCCFNNISIDNVRRRAISLWGKNTRDTKIKFCNILNMELGTAINIYGSTSIEGCNFINCNTVLQSKYRDDVYIKNSRFENINVLFSLKNKVEENIILENNEYDGVNIYLNYIE